MMTLPPVDGLVGAAGDATNATRTVRLVNCLVGNARHNEQTAKRRNGAIRRRPGRSCWRRRGANSPQSGLAGARVDEIAARAGVNKQLVYHYFGDKDALYLAVLEWVYEEIRAQERKLNLVGLPPERPSAS